MRYGSYAVPLFFVGLLALAGKPSWWALAMLTGGAKFAWDYLWGDTRVLRADYGLRLTVVGVLLVAVAFGLGLGLGMTLAEFQSTAKGLPRREAFLYNLPSAGIGIALYGAIVWSRAWSLNQGH